MDITGIFSESFWYVAAVLLPIVVTITGAINAKFNITKGIWPQIVSWGVGTALSLGAWFLNLVQLGEPTWVSAIALCVVIGLSSNGFYDIPTIKNFIDNLFKFLRPATEKK